MSALSDWGIPAIVGGAAGAIGSLVRDILSSRMKTDEKLRDLRTPVYKELWKLTERLPKWPRADITYRDLYEFSAELKTWYFEKGGFYLSRRSHKRYTAVQDALLEALTGAKETDAVSDDDYEAVRAKCSALRTEMTEDLLSRREGSRLLA
jgi:hypothetical protein